MQSKQQGLTLVEIMVALTLGLILTGGVLQVFLSSKHTYRFNDATSLLQESARFALDTISRDIRIAGYQGCADPNTVSSVSTVLNNSPTNNLLATSVSAVEGNAASDSLTLQYASPLFASLSVNSDPANATLTLNNNPDILTANEVVIVADCNTVHLVRATDVSPVGSDIRITYANTANDLSAFVKSYSPDNTRVMRLMSVTYSIADTGRRNSRGDAIFALFRQGLNDANPVELVEGVESLQIQFAERLADGNLRYMAADDANLDMTRVVAVQVGLLMHTVDAVTDNNDSQSYVISGTSIDPTGTADAVVTHAKDKRLRRAFNATVNLRNRQ